MREPDHVADHDRARRVLEPFGNLEARERLERPDPGVRAGRAGREEIMAEQLRLASRALGKLLGRVDVEDILDVIFRDFCIGK